MALLAGIGLTQYRADREMVMVETVGPTVTVTVEPTATNTPLPTITPTPLPTETPLPPNRAAEIMMTSDVAYVTAALVDAEAQGMGVHGQTLVACNVLADLYDVGGDWHRLEGRWAPLKRILSGAMFPQPTEVTQIVVQDANGTEVCRDYPRCRFLGMPSDIPIWYRHGDWDTVLPTELYVGPTGQVLVCILGLPDLPTAPGK